MKREHSQTIDITGVFNYLNTISGFIKEYNYNFDQLSKKEKNNYIKLELEESNPYDVNAVRVYINNDNNDYDDIKLKKSPNKKIIDKKEYMKIGYLKNDDSKIEIIKLLKKTNQNYKFILSDLERDKIGRSVFVTCKIEVFLENVDLQLEKIKLTPNKELNEKIRNDGYDMSF